MPKVSAKATRREEIAAEKDRAKSAGKDGKAGWRTGDSFQNFVAKLGIGTENLSSAGTYGFNPITRERTLLEWIHRGQWVAGLVVDLVADDMTRAGVEIEGSMPPEDMEAIENEIAGLGVWAALRDAIAWGRLYGGSLCVAMIDGQDFSTPLRVETVGKGQFRGLLALDRWMLTPSINDTIQELGPHIGLPKYYDVQQNAPGLRGKRIHHSRCFRFGGNRLPYYQRLIENLWDESILERIYDRLLAFDSTTQGAAQLVYKAYVRTYGIKNLRELIATGGEAVNGLVQYVNTMAQFQSIEGITLLDSEDRFEAHEHAAFTGLADVLIHLGQQISGAVQLPLVRLFGQSPTGLNSTGESDMRTYYDGIASVQHREMHIGTVQTYKMAAMSLGIKPPDDFTVKFRPLWLMSEKDRAEVATAITNAVAVGLDMGVPQSVCFEELRQSSPVTNVWSNISDEHIAQAKEETTPPMEVAVQEIRAQTPVGSGETRKEDIPASQLKPNGKGVLKEEMTGA
jgi:phage-related protein (TIGR01555 family)